MRLLATLIIAIAVIQIAIAITFPEALRTHHYVMACIGIVIIALPDALGYER